MTRTQGYALVAATFVVLFIVLTKIDSRRPASDSAYAASEKLVNGLSDGVMRVETPCSVFEKSGTGFLVGPRMVATALHVVNGSDQVSLSQDGQLIATGAVVGRDYAHDLALVETDRSLPGHVFTFSTEPAVPGEPLGALGFTGGRNDPRETRGTVVLRNLTVVFGGIERPDLVEVAMPLDHGDSGGPIFDIRDGRVVAVADARDEMGVYAVGIDAQAAGPLISQWAAAPEPIQGSSC